jgi:plasmid stabilization system protein ParE
MGLTPLGIRWADPAERDLDALLSYIAFIGVMRMEQDFEPERFVQI